MKRALALGVTLVFTITTLVVFAATAAATTNGNPTPVLITKCGTSSNRPNKTFTGKSTFIVVRKNGCATIDKGAIAKAYDNSLVAAHGNSAVIGYGHATLIIYNADVTCATHGPFVDVIYAYTMGITICRHFK